MTSTFRKNNFTTSQDVYVNCLRTHNTSIVNKDLVKTYQSNAMRIGQKLSSTNLGGITSFVQTTDDNSYSAFSIQGQEQQQEQNTTKKRIIRCRTINNKNKF
jgi:hypothetical protein